MPLHPNVTLGVVSGQSTAQALRWRRHSPARARRHRRRSRSARVAPQLLWHCLCCAPAGGQAMPRCSAAALVVPAETACALTRHRGAVLHRCGPFFAENRPKRRSGGLRGGGLYHCWVLPRSLGRQIGGRLGSLARARRRAGGASKCWRAQPAGRGPRLLRAGEGVSQQAGNDERNGEPGDRKEQQRQRYDRYGDERWQEQHRKRGHEQAEATSCCVRMRTLDTSHRKPPCRKTPSAASEYLSGLQTLRKAVETTTWVKQHSVP